MEKKLSPQFSHSSLRQNKPSSTHRMNSSEKSLFSGFRTKHIKMHRCKPDEEKGVPSMQKLFKDPKACSIKLDFKPIEEIQSFQEEMMFKLYELEARFKLLISFTFCNLLVIILELCLLKTDSSLKNWKYSLYKLGTLVFLVGVQAFIKAKSRTKKKISQRHTKFLLIFSGIMLYFAYIGEILFSNVTGNDFFCLGFLVVFFTKLFDFSNILVYLVQTSSFIVVFIGNIGKFQLENVFLLLSSLLAIMFMFNFSQSQKNIDSEHFAKNVDCSERKKFYKSVFDLFPDGLSFINQDLETEYTNKPYKKLLSMSNISNEIITENLKSVNNIDYEHQPSKRQVVKKSMSLPLKLDYHKNSFIKAIKPRATTLKTLKSGKLNSDKKILGSEKFVNLNSNDSIIRKKFEKANTLKTNHIIRRSVSSELIKKFQKKPTSKKTNFSRKTSLKYHEISHKLHGSCKNLRLLQTCNDENVLESLIFGKVKNVEFTNSNTTANIFISNHQNLFEAISTTIERMGIYKSHNSDLNSFNAEFNSVLLFRTVLQDSEKGKIPLEIKIIPIFFQEQPKLIISVTDCTAMTTLELMKRVDEYKNILMSYVSHELRTPLNGMLAMMESLKEKTTPEIIEQFVDPSLNCGQNLLCLVNDILDFEQIRKGKMRLFEKEFVLKSILEEAMKIIRLEATKKNVNLCIDIDQRVPRIIVTDPNRLRQIVLNLLGNALKFTCSGSITIKALPFDDYSHVIRISVIDTGLGIKQEDQNKLFKQFGKLDLKEKNFMNAQGVGLGLIISHTLAGELAPKSSHFNNLKGLKVKSEYGQGSEFFFLLENRRNNKPEEIEEETINIEENYEVLNRNPQFQNKFGDFEEVKRFEIKENNSSTFKMKESHLFPVKPILTSNLSMTVNKNGTTMIDSLDPSKCSPLFFKNNGKLAVENKSKHSLKPLCSLKKCLCSEILLVDDNFYNIMVLETFMKKMNLSFEIGNNGQEAIDKVKERSKNECCPSYSFIFMDCDMPIKNGLEATKEIKSLSYAEKTVIIATTAFSTQEEKKKCLESGMDDVLFKPINLKQISDVIKVWRKKNKKREKYNIKYKSL